MKCARHFQVMVLFFLGDLVHAQDPTIQSIINSVNVDSMMIELGRLSGETPVDIGNGPEVIFSRNESQPGNALAADWLQDRCQQMGYSPFIDLFDGTNGENVVVEIPGQVHPERHVIVCGHYDSMPAGPVASPAADDDGSGTVAVLEALRVLGAHAFENTIVFAMWDEEELGKLGSIHYANGIDTGDVHVVGVVNMDAISYDGDGDGRMRVHTKNIANSVALKDTALMVNQTYAGLQIPITVVQPGLSYSDHASFWNKGLSAILVIEDFEGDGNPYYHTSSDLVEHIDQPYFLSLARLAIGTAAVMARPMAGNTAVAPSIPPPALSYTVFPNPTTGSTTIRVSALEDAFRLDLFDAMGRYVHALNTPARRGNERLFQLDMTGLPAGTYTVRLTAGKGSTGMPLVYMP